MSIYVIGRFLQMASSVTEIFRSLPLRLPWTAEDRAPSVGPANPPVPILAVMDRDSDFVTLEIAAQRLRHPMSLVSSYNAARRLAKLSGPAVVMCDRESLTDWRNDVETLARKAPQACIILMSPTRDIELWEEVTQTGGYDVVLKPLDDESARRILARAVSYVRLRA
jgi:DNA-binding NtrC family response regulator